MTLALCTRPHQTDKPRFRGELPAWATVKVVLDGEATLALDALPLLPPHSPPDPAPLPASHAALQGDFSLQFLPAPSSAKGSLLFVLASSWC